MYGAPNLATVRPGRVRARTVAGRLVRFVHLGLPEARFYLGCQDHMHAFRRVGYRSGDFLEDSAVSKVGGAS